MSNSDSFIDEVSEEVRRDKLFALMRRYGWIAILLILVIVGGAAWTEWSRSQADARARALGDALLDAVAVEDPAERADALAAVEASGPVAAVAALLRAADQEEAGDVAAAVATLQAIADDAGVPGRYRDLARLKALMIGGDVLPEEARREGLEAMAVPGRPYRTVALEQLALADLAAGDTDRAVAGLTALLNDAEASDGLRARAERLIGAIERDGAAPVDDADAAPMPAEAVVVDETVAPEAETEQDVPQDAPVVTDETAPAATEDTSVTPDLAPEAMEPEGDAAPDAGTDDTAASPEVAPGTTDVAPEQTPDAAADDQ